MSTTEPLALFAAQDSLHGRCPYCHDILVRIEAPDDISRDDVRCGLGRHACWEQVEQLRAERDGAREEIAWLRSESGQSDGVVIPHDRVRRALAYTPTMDEEVEPHSYGDGRRNVLAVLLRTPVRRELDERILAARAELDQDDQT